MKRLFSHLMLVILLTALTAMAQIPQTISYQGMLTDTEGTSVSDGDYSILFNLYNVPTGGSPLWTETQTVTLSDGVFNVQLGAINPLTLPFDEGYWLGITIDSGSELEPRIELTSSAYSLKARSVADESITAASVVKGQLVHSINSLKDDVKVTGGDNITVSQVGDSLVISTTGAAGKWSGETDIYYISGNVGIGAVTVPYPLTMFPASNTRGISITHTQNNPNETSSINVHLTKSASDNTTAYGIFSQATNNAGTGPTRAIYGYANGNSTGIKAGVQGYASGVGNHYGVYGHADGSGTQYGVWGHATGDGTLWAGYFTGNVYAGGNLGIGTTTPSTPLEVNGTIQSSSGGFMFPDGTTQTTASNGGGVSSIDDLSDGRTLGNSVFLGSGAGAADDGTDNLNVAVGVNALSVNITGFNNTAHGYRALFSNTGGNYNTAIGLSALYSNTTGSNNVAIGNSANFRNQEGSQNTIIGIQAGYGAALHNKSGNVFLGFNAGYNETGDNKLYIENSNSSVPLIGGDFSADEIYLNGKVGIDVSAPSAELQVGGTDGVLFTGTYGSGTLPATGTGTRMMWYPRKAAFRAGYVDGTQWDDANIGNYSTAMGYGTRASGTYSTAIGYNTTASSGYSTAMGRSTTASGTSSTAMGYNTTASSYSTAMGNGTTASGFMTTAMGYNTTASGYSSTAMGRNTTASGDYSTAMGSYVTAQEEGAFAIGDHSTTTTTTYTYANSFNARFANGYRLYTVSGSPWIGARLGAGANSWESMSDSTKKENIQPVNSEEILTKIGHFNLSTWNYIGQDAAKFRHYGPMAQDFFAAFGNDGIGTIGCDTLLSSADFDGINFIAIQALEKRTTELKEKVAEIEKMRNDLISLKEQNSELTQKLVKMESGFKKVEAFMVKYQNQKKGAPNKITFTNVK